MAPTKLVALILIVAGILALVYGGFTYTKTTHKADLGPVQMEVKDREHVNVPVWAGILAVGAGAVILLVPQKS